jgi:hypothetical protein
MIEFESPKPIVQQSNVLETVAVNMMRPVSRYFDDHEHEIPWDYINFMHMAMRATGAGSLAPREEKNPKSRARKDRASATRCWPSCWRCSPGEMLACTWSRRAAG